MTWEKVGALIVGLVLGFALAVACINAGWIHLT